MKIVWEFTPEEANAILQLLGNVPTQQGAYPLFARLKADAESQLKANEPIPQVQL